MSIIIGLKHNGKVYMGADTQAILGDRKSTHLSLSNLKVWKTKGIENSLMAQSGNVRDGGLIKTIDLIPEEVKKEGKIDFDFVQGKLIYDIFDKCKEKGLVRSPESSMLNSRFLFAYKDKLYVLCQDMTVFESENYCAIGAPEETAMVGMRYTEGEEPEIRLLKALALTCEVSNEVNYPLVITDNESGNMKIYTKEQVDDILKKAG